MVKGNFFSGLIFSVTGKTAGCFCPAVHFEAERDESESAVGLRPELGESSNLGINRIEQHRTASISCFPPKVHHSNSETFRSEHRNSDSSLLHPSLGLIKACLPDGALSAPTVVDADSDAEVEIPRANGSIHGAGENQRWRPQLSEISERS